MKKRLLILLLTIPLFLFVAWLAFKLVVLPHGNGQTNFILVKGAEMMRSGIKKQNAAILITDKELIEDDEGLFLGNNTYGHACGYHYSLQFWDSADSLIETVAFNKDCEEFVFNDALIQLKMKGYIRVLETQPTHYIYNLEIPVATEPETVKKACMDAGLRLFFMKGTKENLSSLTFNYMQVSKLRSDDKSKWQAEEDANEQLAIRKMNAIIDDVKLIYPVLDQSNIHFPLMGFGGTIEHKAEVTLKFKNGTDLTKVKQTILARGALIEKENNPASYFVQLVENKDDLQAIKEKLKPFGFITAVYEYPATK